MTTSLSIPDTFQIPSSKTRALEISLYRWRTVVTAHKNENTRHHKKKMEESTMLEMKLCMLTWTAVWWLRHLSNWVRSELSTMKAASVSWVKQGLGQQWPPWRQGGQAVTCTDLSLLFSLGYLSISQVPTLPLYILYNWSHLNHCSQALCLKL